MKQITNILLAVLLSVSAFATDEIKFVENMTWKQVKEKALKEKKMIFLDAYASWCGPCKYMEESVYKEKTVADFFNNKFINVKIDMEKGEGPGLSDEFAVDAYPTFLFFSPEGKLVHKFIGALEKDEFVDLGKAATNPLKQYFTLKDKAAKLELSDADFSFWASQASDFKDEDRYKILEAYFASKNDPLGNKDIASTLLFYSGSPTDEQLTYLYKNKKRINELMEWGDGQTATALYDLVFRKAIDVYEDNDNSVDSFLAFVGKFDPSIVSYAKKDIEFKLAIAVDQDADKATELLIGYIKDVKEPETIEHIAGWIIDFSSKLTRENMESLTKELSGYTFRASDMDKEYWLYLAEVVINMKTGNDDKAKDAAIKALKYPQLPKSYVDILKESYGLNN